MNPLDTKNKPALSSETDPLHLWIKKTRGWLHRYFKYLLAVLILAFSAGGSALLYKYWKEHNNQQAEEKLYTLKKELRALEQKLGGSVLSESEDSKNFFQPVKKAKYNSEIKSLVQKYEALIKKQKNHPSAVISAIELAYFLYQYGRLKQAVNLLKAVQTKRADNLIGLLLSYQLALYFMDQGDYNLALSCLDLVLQSEKDRWIHPLALLEKAVIYEKQNNKLLAEKFYRELKENFPESRQAKQAEQYLNFLLVESRWNKEKADVPNKLKTSKE